jgi:hypothetical protein
MANLDDIQIFVKVAGCAAFFGQYEEPIRSREDSSSVEAKA